MKLVEIVATADQKNISTILQIFFLKAAKYLLSAKIGRASFAIELPETFMVKLSGTQKFLIKKYFSP